MAPADAQLKAVIDEMIAPLIEDQNKFLAGVRRHNQLVVSRADLVYVTDQYGTKMLDFSAKMAPVGHRHPFVTVAIKEHIDYYLRTAALGEHVVRWPIEYARDLVHTFAEDEEIPDLKVLFTEGESEAMTVARSIANVSQPCHWVSILKPDITLDSKESVQLTVQRARENGNLIIFNESDLGFGRLGTYWAQQYYEVKPDITVLGGPLGGGLALGAVVTSPELFDNLTPYVSQQAGSPVACAAGANTLRAVNPGVLEHVKEAGEAFQEALESILDQFPGYVVAAPGAGLWRTIEFQTEGQAIQFEADVRNHGLLVAPPFSSSITLTPPLIASTVEILRGVDLIADTLLEWGDEYL